MTEIKKRSFLANFAKRCEKSQRFKLTVTYQK